MRSVVLRFPSGIPRSFVFIPTVIVIHFNHRRRPSSNRSLLPATRRHSRKKHARCHQPKIFISAVHIVRPPNLPQPTASTRTELSQTVRATRLPRRLLLLLAILLPEVRA